MKNIFAFVCILLISSCTNKGREFTQKEEGKEITRKIFQTMVEARQVDHVEVSKKKVYVFLTDSAATKLELLKEPQYNFSINSYDSFLNEMESLDQEHLVQPVVK